MDNPWTSIDLAQYEKHMGYGSVQQLQVMNRMMADQFHRYGVSAVAVLGVAGGNGLEHADFSEMDVYGVDINPEYLQECTRRFPEMHPVLTDLSNEDVPLPRVELVIANLFVEYVGCAVFAQAVLRMAARFVSCAIQINEDEGYVSDSPYLHIFDRLCEVHQEIGEQELTDCMCRSGYLHIFRERESLPNGKALLRIDFERTEENESWNCHPD